ncbi:hypothetical protein DNU06_09065 [Putridiphycobacter roseus]|uniref:Uncharacterized protein n=1 Tax=Putridiphycobacter roseus TaxID=2219161 RepID=A0A2W1N1H4_9FLAO|nr:hypothetical protein [Putridiphycobacter roseus]PZE17410.1 hypothetical protein DNU06_09065 [Putridiphycobacter roseus]
MESDFNKWQNLWQQEKSSPLDIDALTIRLHKLERITQYQRLLFLSVTVYAIYAMLTHLSLNGYNLIAFILLAVAMLFMLVPLFNNRLKDYGVDNQQYINNRIKYLKGKILIPKLYFLIFIVLFTAALNIAFIGLWEQESVYYSLFFHAISLLILLVLLLLRKIGVKNYEKEILPLIASLTKLNKEE